MSDPNMQLVRGSVEGYNLAVGEPVILQEKVLAVVGSLKALSLSQSPLYYPQFGGEKELLDLLKLNYPDSHVVITNGAKQAIEAAFYAFQTIEGKTSVCHSAPHWPTYPALAKNRGLEFSHTHCDEKTIKVITSPNNPDGKEFDAFADIYDAAYDTPAYGSSTYVISKVTLYSAAKMFGLSGLRVGWAVTQDKKLADAMAYYVEVTTSGVAVSSQRILAEVISKLELFGNLVFNEARTDMMINACMFNRYIAQFCEIIEGLPESGKGMFAWFKIKSEYLEAFEKALAESKVFIVTGEACGASEKGWFRMSMGQNKNVTKKALEELSNSLLKNV
ncbi:pyridoxal phosphate-dependent aminotransferase [bacterium]|nr:pyridoxal phosphate-dependent aminotransferase [bacterium]